MGVLGGAGNACPSACSADRATLGRAGFGCSDCSESEIFTELRELRLEEADEVGDFARGDNGDCGIVFRRGTLFSGLGAALEGPFVDTWAVTEGRRSSTFAAERARCTAAADGVEAPARSGPRAALFVRADWRVLGGPVVAFRVGDVVRDEFGERFNAGEEGVEMPVVECPLPVVDGVGDLVDEGDGPCFRSGEGSPAEVG